MEREKRPIWTMDVMIMSNLNELSRFIDDNAVKAEAGDLNAFIEWKAGLKQMYRNLKSMLIEQVNGIIEEAFNELDKLIDPATRQISSSQKDVNQIYHLLSLATEMVYQARNDLFVRMIEIMTPKEKGLRYALSSLPDEEVEKIVRREEGGAKRAGGRASAEGEE